MLPIKDYKKICRQLNRFGFSSYEEFLDSSLWKEFRNCLYRKNRPHHCSICKSRFDYLELHHNTYKRLLDPDCVIWVCDKCHKKIHGRTEESVSKQTEYLITHLDGRKKKNGRTCSLKIVRVSGLPETLHHSLHACKVIDKVKSGALPKKCLEDYLKKKSRKNDSFMIDLLEKYSVEALEYLAIFTTN